MLLGLQEKWDLAADAYRQALALNPHSRTGARTTLDRCSSGSARSPKPQSAYRQAVKYGPGFRLARFNLARMLIALAKPDEAVIEVEKIDGAA